MKIVKDIYHIFFSSVGLIMFFLNPLFIICIILNGGDLKKVVKELFYEI